MAHNTDIKTLPPTASLDEVISRLNEVIEVINFHFNPQEE